MAFYVALPTREPDAADRAPLNIRRADHVVAANRHPYSPLRTPMRNLRPVDPTVQARVLGEFFTSGHVANVPAVESETLRQAVAARTPDVAPRSGEAANDAGL